MKDALLSLTVALVLLVATAVESLAEYSPRTFFTAAPISTFYTEDEMTQADRSAIVRHGFQAATKFTCEKWEVAEETPTSLVLKNCPDSSVRIQVYPGNTNNSVVAVESTRSSGRAVTIAFFTISNPSNTITPLSSSELSSIGIEPLTENDFLSDKDKFNSSDNEVVSFALERDGSLTGILNTWMDPRWEKREQAYRVTLTWNGQRFERSTRAVVR